MIKLGSQAPNFHLESFDCGVTRYIGLESYKGSWVVLFFWPLDFTMVCPTEIQEFNRLHKEFRASGAYLFGCSVDSVYAHQSWQENGLGKIDFPMLSDLNKHVSKIYEVLDVNGVSERGTFIIDPTGNIRWFLVSDMSVGRSPKETLRALHALQTGKLCPVDWQVEEPTLN